MRLLRDAVILLVVARQREQRKSLWTFLLGQGLRGLLIRLRSKEASHLLDPASAERQEIAVVD